MLSLNFAQILEYGRKVGNPALRKMTFQERGLMLKKLAMHLMKNKRKLSKCMGKVTQSKKYQVKRGRCPL